MTIILALVLACLSGLIVIAVTACVNGPSTVAHVPGGSLTISVPSGRKLRSFSPESKRHRFSDFGPLHL